MIVVAGQEFTPFPSVWRAKPLEHSIHLMFVPIKPVLAQLLIPVPVPVQEPSSNGFVALVVVNTEFMHSRQE